MLSTLYADLDRVVGSKIQVAGWTIYSALIWSLKLSMLYFYTRLTVRCSVKYSKFSILTFAERTRSTVPYSDIHRIRLGHWHLRRHHDCGLRRLSTLQ